MSDYSTLPAAPAEISPCAVLNHTLDSLAFRFYWATEHPRHSRLASSPAEGAITPPHQIASQRIARPGSHPAQRHLPGH